MKTNPGDPVPLFFQGDFDYEALYRETLYWMKKYQIIFIYEKMYKDKIVGPGIREVEVKLVGSVKYDEYVQWNAQVLIKTFDMKVTDRIGPSGKPIVSGRMEIYVSSTFDEDYQNAYAGDGFTRHLRKIRENLFGRGRRAFEYGDAAGKMYELQATYKRILGIKT